MEEYIKESWKKSQKETRAVSLKEYLKGPREEHRKDSRDESLKYE